MLINWFGECCFLLQDKTGHRIILNPYTIPLTNYSISLNPNLILLSDNRNTAIFSLIKNADIPIICNKYTDTNLEYIKINSFNTYKDKTKGLKRGQNTVFIFSLDNLRICYLGYLGHDLSDTIIDSIGNIDILFIPIGGHLSLDGYEAALLTKKIKPKLIIPMLYRTSNNSIHLDNCRLFLLSTGYTTIINDDVIDTSLINGITPQILLLKITIY